MTNPKRPRFGHDEYGQKPRKAVFMHVTREQYHAFSTPLEGRVPGMYCDVLGLITCGVGNLIDPIEAAEKLPWTLADGKRAELGQVRADWHKLKDNSAFYAKRHWRFALEATECRLTEAAIDELVSHALDLNEAQMQKTFPEWDSFPADAQLALMSMCWAVGAGWPAKFGTMKACVLKQDWEGCVATCKIREEGNPGVVPRNAKNRFCLHNAAIVKASGSDGTVLHWPEIAPATPVQRAPAADAKVDADLALAAWRAHVLYPYVVPGSGSALRDFEAAPAIVPAGEPNA